MLEPILGSKNAERVLMFILKRGKGYSREISRFYETDLNGIQKQLEKFETGGILVSEQAGRTRIFRFNPRYPFLEELKALLKTAFSFYEKKEQEDLSLFRQRPIQRG